MEQANDTGLAGAGVLPFKGVIEGYAQNQIQANMWRFQNIMEFEDLQSTAYEVYLRILGKYGAGIETPEHFMSLYKTALRNEFNDLSVVASKQRQCESLSSLDSQSDDDFDWISNVVGDVQNEAFLHILSKQAPKEVAAVMAVVFDTPIEIYEMMERAWTEQRNKKLFLGNNFLCEMLGKDPEYVDLVQITKDHFLEYY